MRKKSDKAKPVIRSSVPVKKLPIVREDRRIAADDRDDDDDMDSDTLVRGFSEKPQPKKKAVHDASPIAPKDKATEHPKKPIKIKARIADNKLPSDDWSNAQEQNSQDDQWGSQADPVVGQKKPIAPKVDNNPNSGLQLKHI